MIGIGVITHRRGIGDVLRHQLDISVRPYSRDAAIYDTADVLCAIAHDHQSVVARLRRFFRADHLAVLGERDDILRADIQGIPDKRSAVILALLDQVQFV